MFRYRALHDKLVCGVCAMTIVGYMCSPSLGLKHQVECDHLVVLSLVIFLTQCPALDHTPYGPSQGLCAPRVTYRGSCLSSMCCVCVVIPYTI